MATTLPMCAGVFVSIIERVPATSHHCVRVVIHFVYIWLCVCRRPSLLLLRFLTRPPRLTFPVKNRCRIFSFSRRSFTSFRLSVVSSPANGTRRCIDCSLYTRNRTIVVPFPQSRRLLSESFLPVLRIADISKREYAVYDCTHEFPCTRTFQHVIVYCVVCKWPKRARRRRRPLDDFAASRDATFFPRTSPRLVLFHSDVSARPKFRVSTVSASLHRFIKQKQKQQNTFADVCNTGALRFVFCVDAAADATTTPGWNGPKSRARPSVFSLELSNAISYLCLFNRVARKPQCGDATCASLFHCTRFSVCFSPPPPANGDRPVVRSLLRSLSSWFALVQPVRRRNFSPPGSCLMYCHGRLLVICFDKFLFGKS